MSDMKWTCGRCGTSLTHPTDSHICEVVVWSGGTRCLT